MDELLAALRRAVSDPQVQGIVITGGPEHFSAGADLAIFQEIRSGEDAVRASRVFQEAFQEIEDCPKPVVAAVAGHVLGGALELAMACHCRVAAEGSRFSMPEVTLGINPGAGGTQRLPRLVGVEPALEMLLSGRPIDAQRALELGLIDAVCPADELLAASERSAWHSQPHRTRAAPYAAGGPEKIADSAANGPRWPRPKQQIAAVRPEIIAPRKILEAVRTGIEESFRGRVACRARGLSRVHGNPCRRRTRSTSSVPAARRPRLPELEDAAPTRIAKAGVLGMGTMGAGIAQALIAAGIDVVACDQSAAGVAGRRGADSRFARSPREPRQADRRKGRSHAGPSHAHHRSGETCCPPNW